MMPKGNVLGKSMGYRQHAVRKKNINPSLLNPPHKRPNPNTSHRMGVSADKQVVEYSTVL